MLGAACLSLNAQSDGAQNTGGNRGDTAPDIRVVRNDEVTVDDIRRLAPTHLVLSPGPGRPADAGICVEAGKQLYKEIPMLGICLGHQAMYEAFGGTVSYASRLMHGKASDVMVDIGHPLFKDVPSILKAARYHSLAAVKSTLPEALCLTAWTPDGEIMAIGHRDYPVYGLQFHPESILTPHGRTIIENFLEGHTAGGHIHD
ncbi:MAG: aminodeoxychorismate/anthranilate synthase component II [Oscillospiraceae bacterium]|nr:aminodeoxychorismate/anthranilate synthase component II [Oscillospiraceae bacterium]